MLASGLSCNLFTVESEETAVSPVLVSTPQVHSKYDDELVSLVAEDQIYRISKILLSQSPRFSTVLGSYSGGQPMFRVDASISEIESFLEVLHARQTEARLRLQPGEWGDALYLSTKWGFSTIRDHVIKQIEVQCEDQGILERFEIALKCQVPQWLRNVYHTLCARNEHITAEEGRRLGYERLTAICRIREILRGEARPNSKDERCRRCNNCTFYMELPCRYPLEASGASALQWIDKEEHLGVSSYDDEEGGAAVVVTSLSNATDSEGTNTHTSTIKDVANIRSGSEEAASAIPIAQMEPIVDQFSMATDAYIEVSQLTTPIPIDKGDPLTSAQRGGIASTTFGDESEVTRSIISVARVGAAGGVSGTESGVYIGTTHPSAHSIIDSSDLYSRPTALGEGVPLKEGFLSMISASEEGVESPPIMMKTQLDATQTSYYPINDHHFDAGCMESITIRPFKPATLAAKGSANQGRSKNIGMQCSFCLQTKPKVKGNPLACKPCRRIQKTKQCAVCRKFKTNVQLETQTCKPCRKQARAAAIAVKAKATPKTRVFTSNYGDAAPSDVQNSQVKNPYLLQTSQFRLSEWKRVYMSKDTRGFGGSLEWFYKWFDNECFSIWRCDYKYPEELTQVFISSSMIGGFFSRILGSRNDIFASIGVLGESNNSLVSGVFICRGKDIKPLVRRASDFESYEYRLISLENEAERIFFEAALAWDLEIDGKRWADGKAFTL
ncbi:hypothetical protein FRB95_002297 [Tulasnella sp. JGI-2019a]|nr:hypothetical protein FRB95_002297 [Tulasnella sp. JGI-2019a]